MPFIDSISDRTSPLFETALEHVIDTARTLRESGTGPLHGIGRHEVRHMLEQCINGGGRITMVTNQANGNVESLDVDGKNTAAIVHSIAAAATSENDDIFVSSGC